MSDRDAHWPLRLLSLAIAIVLWLFYSYGEREQALLERVFDSVNVSYNTPADLILLNPVATVSVRVSGNEETIRQLSPFEISATVDLEPRTGIQEVILDDDMIRRPRDVAVDAITPDRLSLQLDRVITKTLALDVVPSGEPAAGAVEGDHRVVPDHVTVTGPASLLQLRDRLPVPVNIDGRARDHDLSVTLDTGDPLIRVQGSSTVRVYIDLETELLPPEAVNGAAAEAPAAAPQR
ncbi:MAG: CdaR family protein [Thermoanaerobaculia bacterium]|nr:CdaR family protein [Thermoanaerobaculia bacterium]